MTPSPEGGLQRLALGRRLLIQSLLLALVTLIAGAGCSEPDRNGAAEDDPLEGLSLSGTRPRQIRIAMTPSSGAQTAELLAPLVSYLEARLKMKVTAVTAANYEDVGRLVRDGAVEVGIFAPLSYVRAAKGSQDGGTGRLNGVALATVTRRGSPTYLGYLIVRSDDGARQLEDLRGLPIAWVSKSSTSGYVYPRALIRHKGLVTTGQCAGDFFGHGHFADNHKAAIVALHEGRTDVAAVGAPFVEDGTLNPLTGVLQSEQKGRDALRVIAKTDRIPLDCIVVRNDISRGVAMQLREALLTLHHDAEVSTALRHSWGMNGFVEPMHEAYETIRAIDEAETASCKTAP